ncbi:hypothetical protein BC829DRAFT_397163 [Chytridium lagenaria]|nr:hypothetical protein BC829DRAFT_397163 [Chytridium lagenaria]
MSMLPPHMRSVTTPRVKPKAEAPAPTPFDFKFCENLPTDTVERAIIVLSKPKNGWGLNVKARREEDLHALPPKPEKKKRRRGNRVRKPKKEDTKALVTLWTPDIGKPNVASESTRSRAPSVTTRSAMTSVTTRNATPNATPRVSKWMAARESVVLERK